MSALCSVGTRRGGALVIRLAAIFVVVTGLCLSVTAARAFAATHQFKLSFGSLGNPNGIAVDESSGDVYVADLTTNSVYKFDANGNQLAFSALGSNALSGAATPAGSFSFPSEPGTPAAIAVDNSTVASDPSAGDLYVMDAGHKVIDKFSSSGAYVGQITGPFSQSLQGLAVDADGHVRVNESGNTIAVAVFDDSQANVFIGRHEPFGLGKTLSPEVGEKAYGFAVAPNGDDDALYSCGCVERFGPNIEEFGQVDSGSPDVALAVDRATGHIYIDDGAFVAEWDAGDMNGRRGTVAEEVGVLASSFGQLQLSGSANQGGIAVNGRTGDVYVSNPTDGKVYVFSSEGPAVAPGFPANAAKETVTLNGAIDPRGVQVASCEFEYGTSSSYGHSVECDQKPADIGAGNDPVPVTATISGLQPGQLYRFRLSATNAAGGDASRGLFATAGPGFGIKSFEVSFLNEDGTPDTQAGSHPYEMITNIAYNTKYIRNEPYVDSLYVLEPDGNFKDVITELPPGLVGDPNATAKKCTLKQIDNEGSALAGSETCPEEAKVGTLEAEYTTNGKVEVLQRPVFNMVPPRGVAAQLAGHFIIPNAFINVGVQAGGDYPVRAEAENAPVVVPVIATRLVVFGVPSSVEPRTPFLTLPTACNGPLKSTIATDSYQKPGEFAKAQAVSHDSAGVPLGVTGCSKLLFPAEIGVAPDVEDASSPTGLTVGVHISQKASLNPNGLAESSLRNTTVVLPAGVAINPAGADGLQACPEGLAGFTGFTEFNPEFEHDVETATFTPEIPQPVEQGVNFCPDGSKIGTVKISTPLLSHDLEGAVYLASQNANPFGSLVAMYIIAEDPISGTVIKLAGKVALCEQAGESVEGVSCAAPGQIVTTFKNTPDLPFEDLQLHFFGGERAPLASPAFCKDDTPAHPGLYTTTAIFVPWDGNGPVQATSAFKIVSGPSGSPCPGPSLPFKPELTAGTIDNQGGAFSPFTMTASRQDGNQDIKTIQLRLPPGLSGMLSKVELCPEPQASLGTCGPGSLIGETTVSVGVGNDPFTVTGGKVYITGPYEGAPFGLSIVNPAKAGPYDLGQVIVRAKIEVDPTTTALTIASDSGAFKIPTILRGIPLEIRHINVTISRPGFTFNPTNCRRMSIAGKLEGVEGAISELTLPMQSANCAVLHFNPRFTAKTSAKTSRALGASLTVKLAYPKAPQGTQANIRSVKVQLPKQLPSRLATLQKACTDATFSANPANCPPASRVGSARATTPLLPVPLRGPAYFVSHGGVKFPELVVVLQGYGVTVDLHGQTFISKSGITTSTFRAVPDVPVGTFELTLPRGPHSALAATASLCRSRARRALHLSTVFTAQNGLTVRRATPIAVIGCHGHRAKKRQVHRKRRRG